MISDLIRQKITRSLETLGLTKTDFALEHPREMAHGDYSSNVAMRLFSKSQDTNSKDQTNSKSQISKLNNPREISEAIKKEIEKDLPDFLEKVEVAGLGFINFYLADKYLVEEMGKVVEEAQEFGQVRELFDKKLMVEYAHPNTHKQFHIGHMRNIALGESLCRIFEANGAKVIRTNYQGDVGLHVAKAIWGARKLGLPSDSASLSDKVTFLGKAYVEGNAAYEEDEKAKKQIQALNIAIYVADGSVKNVWEKTRSWSLEYFDWIYKRVYAKYDRLYFESEVAEQGKKASKEALKKGVLSRSQGAVVFLGEKHGVDTRVFLTKEDLPTYEGKELGLAALEFSEFGEIDKCIHVVGPEQKSFFEVTFKVEELLDPEKYKGKQKHFVYGYVQLKEGKMSSRKGNILTGEWLLDEAKKMIEKVLAKGEYSDKEKEEIAEMVAVGAVKHSMLRVAPIKNIAFDFGESVSFEGNSGPYLQYTFARAKSVLRKSQTSNNKDQTNSKSQIPNYKKLLESIKSDGVGNQEEKVILRLLYQFPEVVAEAGKEYAPHKICDYLFALSQAFNGFYNMHSILGSKKFKVSSKQRDFRLVLTAAVAQVVENGLYLLGIKSPRKM